MQIFFWWENSSIKIVFNDKLEQIINNNWEILTITYFLYVFWIIENQYLIKINNWRLLPFQWIQNCLSKLIGLLS